MVEIIPPASVDKYELHNAPLLSPSGVPDYVTKARQWVLDNPDKIRELIPEQLDALHSALYTAEIDTGLPIIGKIKVGQMLDKYKDTIFKKYPIARVFLDTSPLSPDALQSLKDSIGLTNVGLDGQGQGDEQENDPEDYMTTQDVRDVIEFMAELSEQGLALPEIADAVWRDYRVEYHPLKIKRMLKAYYARPDDEKEPDDSPQPDNQQAKVIHKVLTEASRLKSENERLKAKEAEIARKTEIESAVQAAVNKIQPASDSKSERVGLIRKIVRELW